MITVVNIRLSYYSYCYNYLLFLIAVPETRPKDGIYTNSIQCWDVWHTLGEEYSLHLSLFTLLVEYFLNRM